MLNPSQGEESCREDLELFVDKFGIAAVLGMLSEVASSKADHLRSNWQDGSAAKSWDYASNELDSLSGKLCRRDSVQLAR